MILFKAPTLLAFSIIIGALVFFSIPDNNKMGMYYFNSYQYETAYQYLNSAKNFEKGDIGALKRIKDYFLINGNTMRALSIQYKLIDLRPHNIDYHLEAEKLCDWNKRPIEKLVVMEKRAGLLKGDEKENLLIRIAEGYRWLKLYKESTRVYQLLKGSNKKEVLESSIEYYLTKREPKAAIEVLERYVDLFPDENKYGTFLIQSYSYVGQKEKAFWQALVQMGLPPSLIKGDFASWLRDLNAGDIRSNWRAHSRLIYLSQEIKTTNWRDTLISIYSDKLSGDTLVAFTIGESYLLIKDFDLAYKYFRLSEKKPDNFRQRNRQLANYYLEMKKPKDSIRCLERLVARYPRNQIYWELLGDTYEQIGNKKKALRAYLKLLRLESSLQIQKERRILFSQPLLSQASGSFKVPLEYKPIKRSKKSRRMRKRVRDKVLAVAEQLEDPNERIEIYLELLSKKPNDLRLLKNLGFTYFNTFQTSKAQEIFERIYSTYPTDQDALEVVAGIKAGESDYLGTLSILKDLEERVRLSDYALALKENALFELDQLKAHEKLCSNIIQGKSQQRDYLILKNRCLSRLGKKEKALELQKSLVSKFPNDNDILLQKAFSELDSGNISEARKDVEILRSRKIESVGLSDYLLELEKIVKKRDALVLFTETQYLKAEDFSYLNATQDVRKRLESIGFGASLRTFKLLSGGDSLFNVVSPYVSYFYNDKFDLSTGYRIGSGDKEFKGGIFAVANYYGRHSFFNATFENSEALILTRNLALEKSARSRTINLYWEKYFSQRRDLFLFSSVLRWARFQEERAQARQFTGEYLYSLMPKRKLVDFYAGAQLSSNTLSSDSNTPNLNQNFLTDSLSYHLVVRAHYNFLNESKKHWRYLLRVASGGDSKRGVGFLKSWQFRGEVSRFYGSFRNFKFYSEYYNETVGVNLGSTFLLGFDWTHRF